MIISVYIEDRQQQKWEMSGDQIRGKRLTNKRDSREMTNTQEILAGRESGFLKKI